MALLFFSREDRNSDFYVQSSDFLVLATDSDLIFLFYFTLVWFFKTWPLLVDQTVLSVWFGFLKSTLQVKICTGRGP